MLNIVDGDTIRALIDNATYRVRYIGIDAPEVVDPGQRSQPYAREASEANATLVVRKVVYLEKDVSDIDQYDRLLRYVWLEDGRMVNEVLVAEGYAQASTHPPDVKHQEKLLEAQRHAREGGRGLWGTPASASSTSTTCPVTRPVPADKVPEEVKTFWRDHTSPPERATFTNFYGNDVLWVVLPTNGEVTTRNRQTGEFEDKFPWYRLVAGELKIVARRLDGQSPPGQGHIPDGYGGIGFQASGVAFPTAGCWVVVATVAGTELYLIVDVHDPGASPTPAAGR